MSLLDDVRRLNECGPGDNDRGWSGQDCHFCGGILDAGGDQWPATGHRPDCPWLSMPRLVALVEAAERLVGTTYVTTGDRAPDSLMKAANVNALVAALRGEEVTE